MPTSAVVDDEQKEPPAYVLENAAGDDEPRLRQLKAFVLMDTVVRAEGARTAADLMYTLQLLRTEYTSSKVHYSVLVDMCVSPSRTLPGSIYPDCESSRLPQLPPPMSQVLPLPLHRAVLRVALRPFLWPRH